MQTITQLFPIMSSTKLTSLEIQLVTKFMKYDDNLFNTSNSRYVRHQIQSE